MQKPAPMRIADSVALFHLATLTLTYALALAFFPSVSKGLSDSAYFEETYVGAILASALLSLVARSLPSGDWRKLLIVLRCYLFIILGYSIGSFLAAKLVLGLGLMADICVLVEYPFNAAGAAVALATLAAAQAWPYYFGKTLLVDSIALPAPEELAVFILVLGSFAFLSIWVMRLSTRQRDLNAIIRGQDANLDTLAELNSKLQGYARTVDEAASERERNRISREIHDVSGYIFTNLIALMDAAGSMKREDPAGLTDILVTARKQAQEGLRETRTALRKLRVDQVHAVDFTRDIHKIVSIFRKIAGITIELSYGNLPRYLPHELGMALFRTIQEALTNSVRHGKVTEVRIGFWVREGRILLTIADNGQGAHEVVKGIGLTGMEERLCPLGGAISLGISPLGGFSLSVEVPLPPATVPDPVFSGVAAERG